MTNIYVVFNTETHTPLFSFKTAAEAYQYLEDTIIDERNNELSMIRLDRSMAAQDKNKAIEKTENIYDTAFNRLESSYKWFCNSDLLEYFEVDEYIVYEVPIDEGRI